jgi:hypothetical protein
LFCSCDVLPALPLCALCELLELLELLELPVSSVRSPSLVTPPATPPMIAGFTKPFTPVVLALRLPLVVAAPLSVPLPDAALLPFTLEAPLALVEPIAALLAELFMFEPERVPFAFAFALEDVDELLLALPEVDEVEPIGAFAAELAVLLPERLVSLVLPEPELALLLDVPSNALLLPEALALALAAFDAVDGVCAWVARSVVVLVVAWVPAGLATRAWDCASAAVPATAMTTDVTTYAGASLRIVVSLIVGVQGAVVAIRVPSALVVSDQRYVANKKKGPPLCKGAAPTGATGCYWRRGLLGAAS